MLPKAKWNRWISESAHSVQIAEIVVLAGTPELARIPEEVRILAAVKIHLAQV